MHKNGRQSFELLARMERQMSSTNSIACRDCRVHLWIGQERRDSKVIYFSADHQKALTDFLYAHKNHSLVFEDNCEGCEDGAGEYREIEIQ